MFRTTCGRASMCVVILFGLLGSYLPAASASCDDRVIKVRVVQGLVWNHTKRPVSGFSLILKDKEGRVVAESSTDSEGRFRFPNVPKGKYFLTGKHPNYAPLGDAVEVTRWRAKHRGIVFLAGVGVAECSGMGQERSLPEWALLETPAPPKSDSH